jgi:hypothetical protein
MMDIKEHMQKYTYQIHSLAFVLMILASVGMYFAARAGSADWIWIFLLFFGLANVLVLFVK